MDTNVLSAGEVKEDDEPASGKSSFSVPSEIFF